MKRDVSALTPDDGKTMSKTRRIHGRAEDGNAHCAKRYRMAKEMILKERM
jgi:hypothetical protein